jgi:hypothetical protein
VECCLAPTDFADDDEWRKRKTNKTTQRLAAMRKSASVRGITTLAVCALALAALAGASSARAGTLTMTSLKDSRPGTLREAITNAGLGDTITFGVKGTIALASALTISEDLTIQGTGPNELKISGNNSSRVFAIQSGNVTIAVVTISDGVADGGSPIFASVGGGVLNLASLKPSNDVVSNNQALGDRSQAPFTYPGYPMESLHSERNRMNWDHEPQIWTKCRTKCGTKCSWKEG